MRNWPALWRPSLRQRTKMSKCTTCSRKISNWRNRIDRHKRPVGSKASFWQTMSHELRSPLNGIIGFSELLYDGKLGPLADRPREFSGRVQASSKHLLHLVNDVLDLSK